MDGTIARLGGRVVALVWAVVCVTTVSVQVVHPARSSAEVTTVGAPVQVAAQGLRVSLSSWAAAAEGDETTVTVEADRGWQAVSDQDWLQVTGVDGGLVLTAGPNTGRLRTATATVTSGRETVTVTVAQGGMPDGAVPAEAEPSDAPGLDPAGGATDGDPTDGGTSPLAPSPGDLRGVVGGTLGTPSVMTGWIVDPANPDQAVHYHVVVSFIKSEMGSTTRMSVLDGWGVADRPHPSVGNHGFTHTVVNDLPGGSLVSACVYSEAPVADRRPAPAQTLVGCWHPG
ncbi:MAG: BACON domain-containing protein [Micrococcales bacterium]|nr:BACON domain-containing protein [Micrococcales bacterium]